ncbi:MAG: Na/Pi cotransporter family protein [Deltaproteobacteria bacterium]|nr:Na/Pi cotransporter family protein [Deltaproteobacteria bacterium]MCL5792568.1 Na/Pi cotransporter family protein [Deltaproteobacteria bacterium]
MILLITSIGSLALFLYGIDLINSSLNKLFREQIKELLQRASKNILWAVIIGGVVTILIQNSNTPIVMLMGFATSRLIDLKGAIGIILGADMGTTLTVQIISFNLYGYAIWFIASGFVLGVFIKEQRVQALSRFLTGFGFIFFSMMLLTNVSKNITPGNRIIEIFIRNPLIGFFSSLALTTVIQNSAATIGLAISMVHGGTINLSQALPIVFGANVGTCSTAVFAMFKADEQGRRVAIMHLAFKIAGVLIIVLLYKPFIDIVRLSAHSVTHQIANAHTLFNIVITLFFAPLAKPISGFFERYVKAGKKVELPSKPKYLDMSALATPDIAYDYALKEIVRLGVYVKEMLENSYKALSANNLWGINELKAQNQAVEELSYQIKLYLTHVSTSLQLSSDETSRQFELINYLKNLEVISDIIGQNLSNNIEKKTVEKHRLSEEGWQEIKNFFYGVIGFFADVLNAVEKDDKNLMKQCIEKKNQLAQTELVLLRSHLNRLNKGYEESIDTSALHIEIVSGLRRIVSQLAYMVRPFDT